MAYKYITEENLKNINEAFIHLHPILMGECMGQTSVYTDSDPAPHVQTLPEIGVRETVVRVAHTNAIDAAEQLLAKAGRVAMVVSGSGYMPGGGYFSGNSEGHDEETQRRFPTYWPILSTISKTVPRQKGEPWIQPLECIYTPRVPLCRNADLSLRNLQPPFSLIDLLYMPPMRCPQLYLEGGSYVYSDARNFDTLYEQVRMQFRVTLAQNVLSIVIPAFGCGSSRNPHQVVCQAYLDVLRESEFKNRFAEVFFAIKDERGYETWRLTLERSFQAGAEPPMPRPAPGPASKKVDGVDAATPRISPGKNVHMTKAQLKAFYASRSSTAKQAASSSSGASGKQASAAKAPQGAAPAKPAMQSTPGTRDDPDDDLLAIVTVQK